MPWIPIAAAAVGAIGGGIMKKKAQDAALENQNSIIQQSIDDLEAIGIPSVEAQKIALEQYQSAGEYNPEVQSVVNLGDSNMTGVSTDPAYKEAQLHALNQLRNIGDSGGLTLTDRANLENQISQVQQQQRGAREAILQKAHERGGYGSGAALAAQLQNQQAGELAANQIGLGVAGDAQARALQAIAQGGVMGGNLRTQDFNEQAQKAKAQDEIAKWNAANRQSVYGGNVDIRNQGQQYNLGNRQNILNANTDIRNKQNTYNTGLVRQNYQDQLDRAKAKANARSGQQQLAAQAGENEGNMWGGIGSGIAQGATAYGDYASKSANRAEDNAYRDKELDAYNKRTQAMGRYS